MEHQYNLGESEYRFACIVWENEPLKSARLVELCAERFGWKKSTTYTVLKNLIGKGILQNENSVVTALVPRSEVQKAESAAVVERAFEGSLPRFVAAFLGGKGISAGEAEELQRMIDEYRKGAGYHEG